MSSAFDATADATTVRPARLALDDLMASVGVDGLVAALRSPGLLAAVDQHAAAVREALIARGGGIDAAGLAAYARSVHAAAYRMGRPVPAQADDVDWSRAGWHLLRLVAVCAVADEAGCL
jgi:hypothetical protein